MYSWDSISTILTSISIFELLLVIFIYRKGEKDRIRLFLILLIASGAFWTISMIFYRSAPNIAHGVFWCKLLYASAIYIPLFYLYFTFVFSGNKFSFRPVYHIFILIPPIFLTILTVFSSFIISDVVIRNDKENQINFGLLYIFYTFYIVGYFSWSYINLIIKYFKNKGVIKSQMGYIFLGTFSGSLLASVTNLLLPTFNNFRFNWLGQILCLFYILSIIYTITRYRFMGIVFLMSKIYVLLILSIYLFIALRGLVFANDFFLAFNFGGAIGIVSEFILIMLLALTVFPFVNYVQKSSDYLFFKGNNPSNIIKKLSLKLNGVIDIEKLLEILNSEFKKFIGAETLSIIYVTNKEGAKTRIEISKKGGIERSSIGKDSAICKAIARKNEIIVQDEIEEGKKNEQLSKEMKKHGAYVVSPLESRGKIVGVILLGQKMTQDAYTEEDLEFTEIISSQTAIAIDNARLYREIKEFNERLKEEIKEATNELQGANKDLKTANEKLVVAYEKLHKLDRAKSEFLSIASHQLRTPLTSIKGFTSLLLEGTYGKISKEVRKILEKVFLSNERLIRLVEDLLNISRIESGRFVFDVKENNIKSLAKEVVDSFAVPVKAKNMKIKLKMPRKKILNFYFDRNKIREVISNFIDNSIKYSEKGTIVIEVIDEKKIVRVAIKDDGLGVKKGELDYIFEKFQRGENIAIVHTDGVGLGLFVCKKIINAHKGKVWAESKGLGKGSTFIFELKKNFKPKDVKK